MFKPEELFMNSSTSEEWHELNFYSNGLAREEYEKMLAKVKDLYLAHKDLAFYGEEYRFLYDGHKYTIDLLFYHVKLNFFIVIGLVNHGFEPCDAGRVRFLASALDETLHEPEDVRSVGLVICKDGNEFLVRYLLEIEVGHEKQADFLKNELPTILSF